MSTVNIAELRRKLQEQQEARSFNKDKKTVKKTGDGASYPFWNANPGQKIELRFLPDGDASNPFPWKERTVVSLPFDGIVGGEFETTKPVTVTVPCVDKKCPVIKGTKYLWADKENKTNIALARQYWKKKSYIYQGFVVSSPFVEEELPENPIRRFVLKPQIHNVIFESIMNGGLKDNENPVDYVNGIDFFVNVRQQGDFKNYQNSCWDRSSRSLSDDELAAIEKYGLFNLSEFIGKEPDADGLEIIRLMFEDSIAGRPFDADQFGQHYRAYIDKETSEHDTTQAPSPSKTYSGASVEKAKETVKEETVTETVENKDVAKDAAGVLATIMAKRNAKKA